MPARFCLDEHIDSELAARLEASGFDVLKAQDTQVLGASDDKLLEFAAADRRILYTHNIRDFKPLSEQWARENREHAGLMYSSFAQAGTLYEWIVAALELYPNMDNLTISLPVRS